MAALALLLARDGRTAGASSIADFRGYAAAKGINLTAIVVMGPIGAPVWATLSVPAPGRSALLLCPAETPEEITASARACLDAACDRLRADGMHLVQTLLPMDGATSGGVLRSAGFSHLADLAYYVREVPRRRQPSERAIPGLTWLPYSAETHSLFLETLAATYEGSLDCPDLAGERTTDDILAGHKAAGDFDPALWQLLLDVDDRPVGLVLLAGVPSRRAMEIVYLGLVPAARGRRVDGERLSDILLGRVLALSRQAGRTPVTLAADAANGPALALYRRHGMVEAQRRRALLRVLGG